MLETHRNYNGGVTPKFHDHMLILPPDWEAGFGAAKPAIIRGTPLLGARIWYS